MALRVAATAMTFALGGIAIGVPHADARAAAPVVPAQAYPVWADAAGRAVEAKAVADRLHREHVREAEAVKLTKMDLARDAKAATEAFAASAGKASPEARHALAIARNRATTAAVVGDDPSAMVQVGAELAASSEKVSAEVAAWEAAEAARKAEEERKAREAAAAAARRGSGGRSSGASSGDPKAYLDGIAAAWGTSIQWGATACGHGTATAVAGCFTGGNFIGVNNAAYQSWSVAKGRGRNVVLHEISHLVIQRTCGTVYVSDRFENVTDAYAILIGAGATTGYGYNSTDMALAQNIKAGVCSL